MLSPATRVLLLGGVRAGKSARALVLADTLAGEPARASTVAPVGSAERGIRDAASTMPRIFVATAQAFDEEMARRIAAHRAERDARWRTIEAPLDLVTPLTSALQAVGDGLSSDSVVVVDCITLWVSNHLLSLDTLDDAEHHVAVATQALVALMNSHPMVHWVFVSNEVGLGVVPPTPLGRAYRDALGRANQVLAAAVDQVELMVAGLSVRLK